MQTENFNKSSINTTVLDVYIQPSNDWHLDDQNYEANSTLNFTWTVEAYEEDFMDLAMDFTNPL